jgi:hypothetical protein
MQSLQSDRVVCCRTLANLSEMPNIHNVGLRAQLRSQPSRRASPSRTANHKVPDPCPTWHQDIVTCCGSSTAASSKQAARRPRCHGAAEACWQPWWHGRVAQLAHLRHGQHGTVKEAQPTGNGQRAGVGSWLPGKLVSAAAVVGGTHHQHGQHQPGRQTRLSHHHLWRNSQGCPTQQRRWRRVEARSTPGSVNRRGRSCDLCCCIFGILGN